MVKYKQEIMQMNKEVGELFGRGYKYLKAAYCIYEDMAEIYEKAAGQVKINQMTDRVIKELFSNEVAADKIGKQRCLFASAITPDGLKSFPETVLGNNKCFKIKDFPCKYSMKLLDKVREGALERGFDVEAYYCAFIPSKLEHIVIPALGVALTTANIYHDFGNSASVELDLNSGVDSTVLKDNEFALDYDRFEFDELLTKAVETIGAAKSLHDLMEKYYIPNMDFDAVQICWESTMERIMGYAAIK